MIDINPSLNILGRKTTTKYAESKLFIKNYRFLTCTVEIMFNGKLIVIAPEAKSNSRFFKDPNIIIFDSVSDKQEVFEIELQTIVSESNIGKKWIQPLQTGKGVVKEKWVFKNEETPVREAFNVQKNEWCITNCYLTRGEPEFNKPVESFGAGFIRRISLLRMATRVKRKLNLSLILIVLFYLIMKS